MIKKMLNTRILVAASVLSSLLLMGLGTPDVTSAEEPIKWRVLSSWHEKYSAVRLFLIPWIDQINKEAKGRLELTRLGPETVPPFEQLKPVRDGVFNVLFTHPAYHIGEIAVGNGMDLLSASSKERRKFGLMKVMDDAYRKRQNIHYLGCQTDGAGYHLMLKEKCVQRADFSGFKIRTTPFYDPLLTTLGAATVKIRGGEIYSALEKGVVDGATWSAFGAIDFKWYEVAKYHVMPTFGDFVGPLLVNLDSWNKLPADLKDLVIRITMEIEEKNRQENLKRWPKEVEELERLGMKKCQLPPGEAKKYLDTFYKETWKFIIKLDPEWGPRLKEAADRLISSR